LFHFPQECHLSILLSFWGLSQLAGMFAMTKAPNGWNFHGILVYLIGFMPCEID
jgi:hypothetical protein